MADVDPPDTVFGIDFSAARDDAGRKTWIAECTPEDDGIVVDRLADAAELLQCPPGRDQTLASLVDLIADDPGERRAFGLDFPFGLPRPLLLADDWHAFVAGTRERDEWGALGRIDDPRSLYDAAERHVDDGRRRLRQTDRASGGQPPTGFRIKTQTYYGISSVLATVADEVSVVPMDPPEGQTIVLETYPAAVFRRLRNGTTAAVHDAGYRRDTRAAIDRRRDNVDALREVGVECRDHAAVAVGTEHALDAMAAAVGTWRACRHGFLPDDLLTDSGAVASPYAVEGYIYR